VIFFALITIALMAMFGYTCARYREESLVLGLPADLVLGLAGLVGIIPVHQWVPALLFAPLILTVAGLGAFAHTTGAANGGKRRNLQGLVRLVPESAESDALLKFLRDISYKQAAVLFGEIDATTGDPLDGGIFTVDQTRIISRVIRRQQLPETLRQLFKGEHRITDEQLTRARQVVTDIKMLDFTTAISTQRNDKV
jgi:hypothetical protein